MSGVLDVASSPHAVPARGLPAARPASRSEPLEGGQLLGGAVRDVTSESRGHEATSVPACCDAGPLVRCSARWDPHAGRPSTVRLQLTVQKKKTAPECVSVPVRTNRRPFQNERLHRSQLAISGQLVSSRNVATLGTEEGLCRWQGGHSAMAAARSAVATGSAVSRMRSLHLLHPGHCFHEPIEPAVTWVAGDRGWQSSVGHVILLTGVFTASFTGDVPWQVSRAAGPPQFEPTPVC